MKYIYVCSTNKDYIDSLRSALVYTDARGLMFRFYTELETAILDVNRLGIPGAILLDQEVESSKIPKTLKPLCLYLTQTKEPSERSIFIYQSTQSFIDQLVNLMSAENVREIGKKSTQIWILDLEERKQSAQFAKELATEFYRRGNGTSILDLSMWGELNLEGLSQSDINLSLLMHEFNSSSKLESLKGINPSKVNFIKGVTHPLDLHQLTSEFLTAVFEHQERRSEYGLIYSGLIKGSICQRLLEGSGYILILESGELDENRRQRVTKVKQWLEGNNPMVKTKLISLEEVIKAKDEQINQIIHWLI